MSEQRGDDRALEEIQRAYLLLSDALDAIGSLRGYVQIDNIYKEMLEFLLDLRERRREIQVRLGRTPY